MTRTGLGHPQEEKRPRGRIEVRLLGGVSARVDGKPVEISGDRVRALLAILAMSAGQDLPTGLLAERVWGDRPPINIGPSLHTLMTRLRRVIGTDLVVTGPVGYSMRVAPDDVDVLRFSRLVRSAAHSPDRPAERQLITEALALWTGRPFEGLRSEWLEANEAPGLVEQYLAAVERRIDLSAGDDPYGETLTELRELTASYPLRESLWVRLLRLLAQCGRTAEALEQYESVRLRIADELGVDPGTELRALHAELLTRDSGQESLVELTAEDTAPATRSGPPPNQLPGDVPGFTGRKAALRALDKALATRSTETVVIVVLHGPGGAGKTSLAVHWSHGLADDFPGGTLFLDLGGYGPGEPVEPAVALGHLLHGLGVPAERIPAGADGRTALLRSTLAGRRVLLVLDNARNAEQVRPLLPGNGAVVLITSRSRLRGLVAREGARQIAVDQLSATDARALLTGRIGPATGSAEDLDHLADRCNHLPLALVIAAEQVAQRSAAEVLDELDELDHRLDALEAGDDPASDLRAVISWSYRALEPDAARFFRLLGLSPGRSFSVAAAAAVAGGDERTAYRLLRRLSDLHLVEEVGQGRYQLHDLLRAYAVEQVRAVESEEETHAAWARLLDWAIHSAAAARLTLGEPQQLQYLLDPLPGTVPLTFTDQQAAIAWFDLELRSLMTMVETGARLGQHPAACRLGLLLWSHLSRLVSAEEALAVQQIAADSARRTGDRLIESLAANQLGTSYGAKGDLDRAEVELTRALRGFEAINSLSGIALARGNLGFMHQLRGEYDEAIRQQQRGLAINRRLGDIHAIAIVLNNLSMSYSESGRHAEAVDTATEALRLSRQIDDRTAMAYNLDTLAQAYAGLGKTDLAVARYDEAVVVNLEQGNPGSAAGVLLRKGKALRAAGAGEDARSTWEQVIALIDQHALDRLHNLRTEARELLRTL